MLDFKNMKDKELLNLKEQTESKIQTIVFDMRLNTNIAELEEELTKILKEIKIRNIED